MSTPVVEWLRSAPSVQDIEWELKKAAAIREWCLRDIGFSVGDRVEIVRHQNTDNGWKPYTDALAVGRTGVVQRIDFNPYSHEGRGAWHADIKLDHEWSNSDGPYGPFWHGRAADTPAGMKPPSDYDQQHHPEGRKHTFSLLVSALRATSEPADPPGGAK